MEFILCCFCPHQIKVCFSFTYSQTRSHTDGGGGQPCEVQDFPIRRSLGLSIFINDTSTVTSIHQTSNLVFNEITTLYLNVIVKPLPNSIHNDNILTLRSEGGVFCPDWEALWGKCGILWHGWMECKRWVRLNLVLESLNFSLET